MAASLEKNALKILERFVTSMPKIELHAHINGSISESTLKKLVKLQEEKHTLSEENETNTNTVNRTPQGWDMACAVFRKGQKKSLDECFVAFKLIHQLCDNEEAAYLVTCDVIEEFADDNVKYLELRTTPRAVEKTGMTKRSYVRTVLKAIADSRAKALDIEVRLLLAIDRRTSLEDAWDTLALTDEMRMESQGCVVGLDLSGDPNKGDAKDFLPVFKEAKARGLKNALHLAEVGGYNEETMAMLSLPPDRIGHGTFLHLDRGGTQDIVTAMRKHNIPLELCLTSNVCSRTVQKPEEHQFKFWYDQGHPCVICTDDKGVFDTSLSEEYVTAAKAFNLSISQVWELSLASIDHIFADDEMKQKLRVKWKKWKDTSFEDS